MKLVLLMVAVLAFVALICACGSPDSPATAANNTSTDATPESRGEVIVAEYLKRDAAPFRKMRVRFTVKTEGEPDAVYELDNWRKQTPDATTTLSQIVRSSDNTDAASLTIEPKGQKATIVTYVPSRNEFRETDTKKMFFGGLTAGELLGEWQKYAFRLIGEKDIDGRKVFEVEGKLKPDAESVAERMVVSFRSDSYLPVELHLFDNSGREIRTYRMIEFKDDPGHPYAAKTEADNPIYKAKITIEILGCEFPATIDDSYFSRDRLKQNVRK